MTWYVDNIRQEGKHVGQERLRLCILWQAPFALEDQAVVLGDAYGQTARLTGVEDEPAEEVRRLGVR